MASPIQISVNQLSRLVGTHTAPVVLDVRTEEDFADDPRTLPAALHFPFPDVTSQVESVVQSIGSVRAVVYCQKGLKISEGVAAALRASGCSAEVLESGHFGWRDAGLLLVNQSAIQNRNEVGQSVWVTRVRPKVDRIACAWLLRRFVDRNAQFLFVSGSQVRAVAEKFNATPFDVEDVFFSHRGEMCTSDTMLEEFGLQSEALRASGCNAEVLESGHFGWRDAGLLLVNQSAIQNRNEVGQSVWVTRVRPKVDRIACAWLLRRFVDRNAQFLFVSGSQVRAVAEKFNATPFDVEDVFFSHRGEMCTFDTMLEEFGLQSEALQRLATVVRGADTDRLDLAPQCAGLMAASLGLSRMYDNDIKQLEAGMLIYDAMYRWARDAFDEKHEWQVAATPKPNKR